MNKKILSGVFIVVVLLVIGVLAVPLVSVAAWKSDTTLSITETLTASNAESEKSLAFLGIENPTPSDYDTAITSLEETVSLFTQAKADLRELGPNTLDVTGQYAETESLRQKFDTLISTIIDNYDEQVVLVKEEKQSGSSVDVAEKFVAVTEKNSKNFDELSALVDQL